MDSMTLLDPEYDETVDEEKEHVYVYLGDDQGYVKLWDLSYYLKLNGYTPVESYVEQKKDTFFPNRKEFVNVNAYAKRMQKIAKMGQFRETERYDPEDSGALIRQVLAHKQSIINIEKHSQGGLISCSKDCQVRVWSFTLDLWGIID